MYLVMYGNELVHTIYLRSQEIALFAAPGKIMHLFEMLVRRPKDRTPERKDGRRWHTKRCYQSSIENPSGWASYDSG